jgi:hypothetical protein
LPCIFVSQPHKKDENMSKEKSNCFELNPKQKKHYENWKRFIENLSNDRMNEVENEKKPKYKPKNFEDYFPIDTVIKGVNNLEYQPYLGA